MGAPAQQPVYYDTEQGQYYTINNQQKQSGTQTPVDRLNNGALGTLFGMGLGRSLFPVDKSNRNYLGSPYDSASPDRFTPKFVPATYPEMNMLFPALNAGLAQGIISSTQPDGAMLGAGRFLAPQTTSQSKGK